MIPNKVNLPDKFALFDERWSPKIVGGLNEGHVKLVKLEGEFVWHHHDYEDELFLVVEGWLKIEFRDSEVSLEEDGMLVVPRGVEQHPVAGAEARVLLFEPASTVNTGEPGGRTSEAEWI